ncbi:MAG TPA: hypothetical protein VIW94_00880 [Acidimicrobiia bacterium]
MFGRLVAGLIVIGLAFGVWIIWPRADEDSPPTTQVALSTTSIATTTTTPEETSTTAAPTAAVIETVEQAEDLLRQFWFGWFEGIYLRDEDRIKEVVASQRLLDNAAGQFGTMEFTNAPTESALGFSGTEILRADADCVVIWSSTNVPFRGGETAGAIVFREVERTWLVVSIWANKNDLWEQDCEAQLEPLA